MADVLAVTLPVFLLIGAGYLAVWRNLFTDVQVDGVMQFTQRFAIPCLLFSAMASLDLEADFDLRLLVSFYAGSISCFGISLLGARMLFDRSWEDAVAIAFATMFANTVLLGLPIATRAYGADSLTPNYTIIAFHASFCYLVGITAMEIARASAAPNDGTALVKKVARAMFRNSLMIGVGLGLCVNLTGLTLPEPVSAAIKLMTEAALPAALFGLGGVLVRYRPEGDFKTIGMMVGLSMIVHPAITFGLGTSLGLTQEALQGGVVTAAMAPGVNSYLFAAVYGRAMRVSASAVLIGTAACVLTVPVWLIILDTL